MVAVAPSGASCVGQGSLTSCWWMLLLLLLLLWVFFHLPAVSHLLPLASVTLGKRIKLECDWRGRPDPSSECERSLIDVMLHYDAKTAIDTPNKALID